MPSGIGIGEPREVVYQSFVGKPGACPRCGDRLRQSRQTYSVATRRGRNLVDSFIVGSDFGWFCEACPVVVINSSQVRELLGHSMPHWDVGNDFCVEGIVDLDAIPEHKQHLPIGGDDNPAPLIEFKQQSAPRLPKPIDKQHRKQRKKLLEQKLRAGR